MPILVARNALSVGILCGPHKAQDRQEEVSEAEHSVVAEDVQADQEDVHVNADERVPTQITVERNVVNADLIDSNVQKNGDFYWTKRCVLNGRKYSVMTEDVNKGKTNVEMVQTDDSEVSKSVDMCNDSEMGDDDNFSEMSDIGSQIMEDTYTSRN